MNIAERMSKILLDAGLGKRQVRRQIASDCDVTYEAVRQWFLNDGSGIEVGRLTKFSKKRNVNLLWLATGSGPIYISNAAAQEQGGPSEAPLKSPLIPWKNATNWLSTFDNKCAEQWISSPFPQSASAFFLRIPGDSMSPDYRDGELISIDPETTPSHGDDVIAQISDDKLTFRRYQETPEGSILTLTNPSPEWPNKIIEVTDDVTIIGVIVGSITYRKK